MAFLPQLPRSPEPGIVEEEEQEQEATVHEQGNVAVGSGNGESIQCGVSGSTTAALLRPSGVPWIYCGGQKRQSADAADPSAIVYRLFLSVVSASFPVV
jgi:hypothetical protein